MRITNKYAKQVVCFVISVLLLIAQIDFWGSARTGDAAPVIYCGGSPVYDEMHIPQNAVLTAEYEFAGTWGELAETRLPLYLPEALRPMLSGSTPVAGVDETQTAHAIGWLSVEEDQVWLTFAPLPTQKNAPLSSPTQGESLPSTPTQGEVSSALVQEPVNLSTPTQGTVPSASAQEQENLSTPTQGAVSSPPAQEQENLSTPTQGAENLPAAPEESGGNTLYSLRPRMIEYSMEGEPSTVGTPSSASTPSAADKPLAEQTLRVTLQVDCALDLQRLPAAGEDGTRSVKIQSGDGEVTLLVGPAEGLVTLFGLMGPLSTDDIFDVASTVSVSLKSGTKVLETDDLVEMSETLTLRYEFEILNDTPISGKFKNLKDAIVGSGEAGPYDVPVPTNLVLTGTSDVSRDMKVTVSGTEYTFGVLNYSASSKSATVTFKGDFWAQAAHTALKDGYIELACGLDGSKIGTNPEVQIQLDASNAITLKVAENQPVDHKVEKTGSFDPATRRFNWTVTVTPGTDPTDPMYLEDDLGQNQIYLAGSMMLDSTTPVTPVADSTKLKIEIATPVKGTPLVYTYQTVLTDAQFEASGASKVSNTARLLDDTSTPTSAKATASATAPGDSKNFIAKESVQSSDGRSIDWTITIYTNDRDLQDLVLYDAYDDNLATPTQVKVTYALGSATTTTALDYNSGTGDFQDGITFDPIGDTHSEGNYKFRVLFPSSGGYPPVYTVTYTTKVPDSYFEGNNTSGNFANKAWLSFGWKKGDGPSYETPHTLPSISKPGNVNVSVLQKAASYNRATHTITWKLTVNPYNVNITEGTITDPLQSTLGKEMTYVNGTFSVSGSNPGLMALAATSTDASLVIDVGNIGTDTYTVTFDTTVNNPEHYAYNNPTTDNVPFGVPYPNEATFNGKVLVNSSEQSVTNKAQATAYVISQMAEKKAGSYNFATRELTWTVTINQNQMPTTNPVLEDTLPKGVTYKSFSVTSSEVSTASFKASTQGQTLTIQPVSPPLTVDKQVTFTIVTQVHPDQIAAFGTGTSVALQNKATLRRDNYNALASNTATATIPNKVLDKTGEQQGDYVKYTVKINPNRRTLPANTRVTDQLPAGLVLKPSSVELHYATVTGSTSPSFAPGTKVSNLGLSVDSASNRFSVLLPPGAHAYILTYKCYVDKIGSMTNNVSLTGSAFSGGAAKGDAAVAVSNATGGASTRLAGKAVFTAVDPGGNVLPGLTYRLMVKIGSDWFEVLQQTTGPDGKLTFFVEPGYPYRLESVNLQGYKNPTVANDPLNNYGFQIASGGDSLQQTIVQEKSNTDNNNNQQTQSPGGDRSSSDNDSGGSATTGGFQANRVDWGGVSNWLKDTAGGSRTVQMGDFDLVPRSLLESLRGKDATLSFTDGRQSFTANGLDLPDLPDNVVFTFEELFTLFDQPIPTAGAVYNPNTGIGSLLR